MIGLVLSMVRARPGQALTAFLLAMFAMAAAVSAPVYSATADRAVVHSNVVSAPLSERVVQARRTSGPQDHAFENLLSEVFTGGGFDRVFSTEYDVMASPNDPKITKIAPRFVYRDDVCAHLRFSAGRCFISETEVILSTAAVQQLGLHVGDTFGIANTVMDTGDYVEAGPRSTFTLVGAFDPVNRSEQYWSDLDYFNPRPTPRLTTDPIFASRLTLESLPDHPAERQALDVVINHDAITRDTLDSINAAVKDGQAKMLALPGAPSVHTELPNLLTRINGDRDLVAQVVPVAAVPLVLLCWFVLFIAVASATQERRLELGLFALRGVTAPRRWWLAAGESIVPILAGAAAGFVLGNYLVRLAAWLLLGSSAGVSLSAGLSWWALTAVAGALVAAVLAQRAELAKRTVDLLRNVPSRVSRWGAPVFEVAVVVLAVVAVVQLRRGGSGLTGFALVAPSAVVIAVALLAARGVLPIAERIGRRSMRRGRIGPTLAAYAISRRPGAQRVLALFVVAIGLLVFAATAAGAAADTRDRRARVELGAPRVLTVEPLSRSALLGKVRAIDPDGRFAMAAAMAPASDDNTVPPMLAVDSRALANTVLWSDASVSAQEAQRLLKPEAGRASIEVDNKEISLDVTIDSLVDAFRVHWVAVVVPFDGGDVGQVDLGFVQTGRHTYTRNLPMCVQKCRLAALAMQQPEGRGFDVTLTMHSLSQHGTKLVDEAGFADPDGWRAPESPGARLLVPSLTPAADGLRAEITGYKGADVAMSIMPTDAPSPLPAIMARTAGIGDHMNGLDQRRQAIEIAAEVDAVPKFGYHGGIVDLEYAERLATDGGEALYPEILLGPNTPADILDRVRAQGMTVTSDRSVGPTRAALDGQGPAVALRFHELAGALAVVLAVGALWLVASLDRLRRAEELRALRTQGVARRDAGASGYLALVGIAAVVAPFATLVSWLLVRDYLPVFSDDPDGFGVAYWPPVVPVAVAWGAGAAALVAAALVAGVRLRAATAQRRR